MPAPAIDTRAATRTLTDAGQAKAIASFHRSAAMAEYRDRWTLPAYRTGEAAAYVGLTPQQVAYWGRCTRVEGTTRACSVRLIRAGISYLQLIELSVVAAMRESGVALSKILAART
ncbi:MAG: hypothetical protein GDA52_07945 [Rhodobacteraceae bacterium]|nr:hypothetical protein [Paracoccaceae bacterium]